jgi:enoyl-CoA hydratase/carnithine racemase
VTATETPSAEELILYEKDPRTKIATLTFNRPDHLNAPTIGMRRRYAELLHRANVDDDVKVLVIRGAGSNTGSGADVPELINLIRQGGSAALRRETGLEGVDDVRMPHPDAYRSGVVHWYANAQGGCRSLQEFKKISILEAKGYCYGWHFYQAADADLVISSHDALFGHPAYRYAGWGPRMWTWVSTMGLRKFQEMVFTGRPFTASEMHKCNFVNSVVDRDHLEDEVAKYALACARTRPLDTVVRQKTFFEVYKQFSGEYMGALITAMLESLGSRVRPDHDDLSVSNETIDRGLNLAVKDNDDLFPAEWRLSKSGRRSAATTPAP